MSARASDRVSVSRRKIRALAGLAVLGLLLGVTGILFTVVYVNITHSEIVASARAAQAAQQRQGEQLEAKLCASLARQAELKPPGGPPADNPSRAYLQQQHAVLAELGPDIGCRKAPGP